MTPRAAFAHGLARLAVEPTRDVPASAVLLLGRALGELRTLLEVAAALEQHSSTDAASVATAAELATALPRARRALALAARATGLPPAVEPPLAELDGALRWLDLDDASPTAALARLRAALPRISAALGDFWGE